MGFFKCAVLYTFRKAGKSLIVLLILLVMATLALSSLMIKRASAGAQADLRSSLGGGLVLEQDQSDQSKWVSKQYGGEASGASGTLNYYDGEKITRELADKIARVPGIKAYNAERICPVILQDNKSNDLSIILPEGSIFASIDMVNNHVSLNACMDTSYNEFFINKTIKLSQGRHIVAGDRNAVIISRAVAEKNGLRIGDKITVTINETITGTKLDTYNKAECEIVGLFDSAVKQQPTRFTTTGQLTDNMIFMDIDTFINKVSWTDEGYLKVHYLVNDPLQLNEIRERILQLRDIDWKCFKISLDDAVYQAASGSVKSLDKSTTVMLTLVMLFSFAILTLFLFLWIGSRTRETGILLAAGIPKPKIILQHVTELLLVAALAFGLSYFAGGAIAQGLGKAMLSNAAQENVQSGGTPDGTDAFTSDSFSPKAVPQVSGVTQIKTQTQPSDLIWITLMGCAVIVSSVLISSAPVYRMTPKQILAKSK